MSATGKDKASDRRDRLAEALRNNLRKRKAKSVPEVAPVHTNTPPAHEETPAGSTPPAGK
jgi:hypothetical protein